MSEYLPYRSLVEEAIVTDWDKRFEAGKSFIVYKISLRNGEKEWAVWRRFSDFVNFDTEIKKIRPLLEEVELPPKHLLYSLTSDPDEEFINKRREGLTAYLDRVIRTVGVSDVGLWNHPFVMTFLDIPLTDFSSRTQGEIESLAGWDREMAIAREILAKALETSNTRMAMSIRGADTTSYTKNFRRQLKGLQKRIERLRMGALNLQKDRMTGQLQLELVRARQAKVDELERGCADLMDTCVSGLEEQNAKEELLSPSMRVRTPTTPTRNPAIPDDIADALRHQHLHEGASPKILEKQKSILAQQDQELDELGSVTARIKKNAALIYGEIREQNRRLEDIAGQTEEANAKINMASRKIKRI